MKLSDFLKGKRNFSDGSSISSEDRETIRYERGDGRYVLIWMDFDSRFFSNERTLRAKSIEKWRESPSGVDDVITAEEREEIIAKVREYFGRRKVQVE